MYFASFPVWGRGCHGRAGARHAISSRARAKQRLRPAETNNSNMRALIIIILLVAALVLYGRHIRNRGPAAEAQDKSAASALRTGLTRALHDAATVFTNVAVPEVSAATNDHSRVVRKIEDTLGHLDHPLPSTPAPPEAPRQNNPDTQAAAAQHDRILRKLSRITRELED